MSLAHKIFSQLKEKGTIQSLTSPVAVSSPPTESVAAAWSDRFYHVAVQGCCHGELDEIYMACAEHERSTGKKIDLLICCGDFQAIRNRSDLDSMAVPEKYKELGDFHRYYSDPLLCNEAGQLAQQNHQELQTPRIVAPYLTIFIGGNHENSDLLAEESYGGFVAPNIYYLGHSGVVVVDSVVRIAGLSGIYKSGDYEKSYPPRPYSANQMWKKSAYHVRRIEVEKLDAYLRVADALRSTGDGEGSIAYPSSPVDLFLSHDWPVGITEYGDEERLLQIKPFFREDIRQGVLGNPHTLNLLRMAKPMYWLSAHLHCFFEAEVPHAITQSVKGETGHSPSTTTTKFVALDKCARRKGFLTFLDLPLRGAVRSTEPLMIPAPLGASRIRRDTLWLRILQASHLHVATNACRRTQTRYASGGSHPLNVFDTDVVVDSTTQQIQKEGIVGSDTLSRAAIAPSTAALLTALHLIPSLPLQATRQCGTQSYSSSAVSSSVNLHGEQHRNQRPRTEFSALPSTSSSAPPPLFFEDLGTSKAPEKETGTSASCAGKDVGMQSRNTTTLKWFEDTL